MKTEKIKNAKSFDELLDLKYGKIGIENRDIFEEKAQYFVISETLKQARKEAYMTQEQLADKVGKKKVTFHDWKTGSATYNFPRFLRIFEFGLGKRVNLMFG